ncbi:MAG: ABC transporter permease subunit [Clostridia bacterium]|jgi:ABC-2 type transport system permease protein|nr:ABC transporter permease subunit [Clostridia bacterium]MBQ5800271.1 ABC transporter permease subunit [Clostridia bacterium]
MLSIYKREMRAYFTTPIGYIFASVFLAISGAIFCYTTFFSLSADVTPYFTYLNFVFVVLLPILTMKLFSEERKQKTEQLLLTAPVSITSMVLAKFLAAYTIFGGCMLVSSLQIIILYIYADVKTPIVLGSLFASLLVGMAFISIGVFVSALTENQLASAVGTIGILLAFMLISLLNSFIPVYFIRFILRSVSIFSRYANFTQGAFDVSALIYYLSISAVFLFLTVRVYDKRRYS